MDNLGLSIVTVWIVWSETQWTVSGFRLTVFFNRKAEGVFRKAEVVRRKA